MSDDKAKLFIPNVPVTATSAYIDSRFGRVKLANRYAECIAQLRQKNGICTALFLSIGNKKDRLPAEFWTYEAYHKLHFVVETPYYGIYAMPCQLPRDVAESFFKKLLLDGGEFLLF